MYLLVFLCKIKFSTERKKALPPFLLVSISPLIFILLHLNSLPDTRSAAAERVSFLLMKKRYSNQQQKSVECDQGTDQGCTNRKDEYWTRVGYNRDR